MSSRKERAIEALKTPTENHRLAHFVTNFEEYLLLRPYGPWMVPEDIPFPPSGRETGQFCVVDVGGSTCRLADVDLDLREVDTVGIITLDAAAKQNIVEFVAQQLLDHTISGDVALTWSFPLYQGKFQAMGKEFTNEYEGQDVIAVFNDAFRRSGVPCQVTCVCTDGASTLLSQRFLHSQGNIALTWGTGINLCIFMDGVVVNTELSMVGRVLDDGDSFYKLKVATEFDEDLPLQPLEAVAGGLYLERIAERVLGEPIDFWQVFNDPSHRHFDLVDAICDRAAAVVAAAMTPFLFKTSNSLVSYTGGVINEPRMRQKLVNFVQHLAQPIVLVPQAAGSMLGAAVLAAEVRARNSLYQLK